MQEVSRNGNSLRIVRSIHLDIDVLLAISFDELILGVIATVRFPAG